MTAQRPYRGAIVIAPPGVMGAWAVQMIHAAAAGCVPALRICVLDRLDAVDLDTADGCIHLVQYPGPSVADVIASGALPVLAFIDDAADSVAFMMRTAGCTFLEALRLTTCAAAINPQLANGVSVHPIRRESTLSAARVIDDAVDHLALPLTPIGTMALKQQFAIGVPQPESLEASCARCVGGYRDGSGPSELSDDQLRSVGAALAPMIAMSRGVRDAAITWPTSLFLSGDSPDQAAPLVADMTGAARILYYGPYLYLPRGAWQANITVGFSKDAVGSSFTVEVVGTETLARAHFEARETGLFNGAFQFTHERPQEALELRFRNEQGSIEGRFGLAWVEFIAHDPSRDHSVA